MLFDDAYDDLDFELMDESILSEEHSSLDGVSGSSSSPLHFWDDKDLKAALKEKERLTKKHARDRRWRVTPRILKDDIRRKYAQMIVNVINSHDLTLLRRFFLAYGGTTVELRKSLIDPNHVGTVPIHLRGIQNVLAYWHIIMEAAPDQVMTLNKIHIRSHEGSDRTQVVAKYRVDFTKLVDTITTFGKVFKNSNINANLLSNNLQSSFDQECSTIGMAVNQQSLDLSPWPTVLQPGILRLAIAPSLLLHVLPKPLKCAIEGVMTLYLNDRRQIETMDMGTPVILA